MENDEVLTFMAGYSILSLFSEETMLNLCLYKKDKSGHPITGAAAFFFRFIQPIYSVLISFTFVCVSPICTRTKYTPAAI